MNGSAGAVGGVGVAANGGLESSPATHHHLAGLAAPAAITASDWHYNPPPSATSVAPSAMQRPPYARNWSAESNPSSGSGNSGQHYLAQIGCQHSVKHLINGFTNSSSKFKATGKHSDSMDNSYSCKLAIRRGEGGISKYIIL